MTDQVPAYMRGLHFDPGFRTTEEAYEYLKQCFPVGRSTKGVKAVTGEPYVTIIDGVGAKAEGDVAPAVETADAAWRAFWEGLYRYAETRLSVREDCKLYFRKLPELDQVGGGCWVRARLLLSAEPELTEGGMAYAAIEPHPPIKPGDPVDPPIAAEAFDPRATPLEHRIEGLRNELKILKERGADARCIAIALTKLDEAQLWVAHATAKGKVG